MSKLSKIILYAVAITVLSWFLPWLYALLTPSASSDPFCAFSPISSQWIVSRSAPGEKPVITLVDAFGGNESSGTRIPVSVRDSLAPQLYYRQLVAHDLLPDTIAGKAVSAHELKTHEAFFTCSPRETNKVFPGIWLMMESMPVRVELSDPKEGFRITDNGIEFIRISDNTVNSDRSRRFTEAMKSRGFRFPAKDLSANITSQKTYDEGYLMIDSEGKLFHIKQRGGRPYVAIIDMPEDVIASKAFIWEESDRSILGLMTDTENRPYVIRSDGHKAIPLPSENGKIDPRRESIMVMGSLFNLTVRYTGPDGSRWRAFDADSLRLIGSIDFPRVTSTVSKIAGYVFPYTLSMTSSYDSLAYPRIKNFSLKALPLGLLLALTLWIMAARRKDKTMKIGALLTLPLGIFAFLPFLLLGDE